jgi:hypothetical protein
VKEVVVTRRRRATRDQALGWLDVRLGREVHAWLSVDLGEWTGSPLSMFGHLHHWREVNPRPAVRSLDLEAIEETYTVGSELTIDFNDLPDALRTETALDPDPDLDRSRQRAPVN